MAEDEASIFVRVPISMGSVCKEMKVSYTYTFNLKKAHLNWNSSRQKGWIQSLAVKALYENACLNGYQALAYGHPWLVQQGKFLNGLQEKSSDFR